MKQLILITACLFMHQTLLAGDSTGRYIYLNTALTKFNPYWIEAGAIRVSHKDPNLHWNAGIIYKKISGMYIREPYQASSYSLDSGNIVETHRFDMSNRLVAVSAGPSYQIKLFKKLYLTGNAGFSLGHDLFSESKVTTSDTGGLYNGTPYRKFFTEKWSRTFFAGLQLGLFLNFNLSEHTHIRAGGSWLDGIYAGRQYTSTFDYAILHGMQPIEISSRPYFRFTNSSVGWRINFPFFLVGISSKF